MSELPFDLLVEILIKVPVKDIIRFRCVCKNWRLLFQDERFISKHTTFAPSMFLVRDWNLRNSYFYKHDNRNGRTNMLVQVRELNESEKQYFQKNYLVVGHCNGLFCLLFEDDTIVVWNPSLRELKTIQKTSIYCYSRCHVGFGYDHSTQDYKILLMPVCIRVQRTNTPCERAEILTLKSSPRQIDFPIKSELYDIDLISKSGTLVGNYLFWHLDYELGNKNETILSFDIVSEKINYSSSPCTDDNELLRLRLYRGRLCIVQHLHVPDTQKIIITETIVWCADHEEKDMSRIKSWSKLFRLELSDIKRSIHCGEVYGIMMIDTITKAGEFFVQVRCEDQYGFKLFAYNFKKNEFREIDLCLSSFDKNDVIEYEATLVPIHI